jgi:hypothetical protein
MFARTVSMHLKPSVLTSDQEGPVRSTIEATDLLRRLALLNSTHGHPDSSENPLETRKERVIELRKKLVAALGNRSKAAGCQ